MSKTIRKDFNKILEAHQRYLETYKLINGGSLKGATPFYLFYTYRTYTTRYSDMRSFALILYR